MRLTVIRYSILITLYITALFRRRKQIEEVKEEIERKRKQWNKRKPGADNRKNSRARCDE